MTLIRPVWLLALLLCVAHGARAESLAANASSQTQSVIGDTQIIRRGTPITPTAGTPIFAGDEIVSRESSRISATLLNDALFVLGENTAISVDSISLNPENPARNRAIFKLSEGSLNLDSGSDDNFSFIIRTDTASISVTAGVAGILLKKSPSGNELIIRNESARVIVTFLQRNIIVPEGRNIRIGPDGSTTFVPDSAPVLLDVPASDRGVIDGPATPDSVGVDLRIEVLPSTSPTPTQAPEPTPTQIGTTSPTPVVSTPTPTAPGITPTLAPAPSPTFVPIVTPTPPAPTATSAPTPEPTVDATPTPTPSPTQGGITPTPTLTPPPPTSTPTPVSPF